ncbi:MAG: hypothetical protein AAGG02_16750 [Cyanobacteria bacterium P01_H01_bin.15]
MIKATATEVFWSPHEVCSPTNQQQSEPNWWQQFLQEFKQPFTYYG